MTTITYNDPTVTYDQSNVTWDGALIEAISVDYWEVTFIERVLVDYWEITFPKKPPVSQVRRWETDLPDPLYTAIRPISTPIPTTPIYESIKPVFRRVTNPLYKAIDPVSKPTIRVPLHRTKKAIFSGDRFKSLSYKTVSIFDEKDMPKSLLDSPNSGILC